MRLLMALAVLAALVSAIWAQPNPDTLWTRTYTEGRRARANEIQLTDDGGFIIAGTAEMPPGERYQGYLVKIDAAGNQEWSRTYGGREQEEFYSVQQTSDGGYIAAGTTESFGYYDGYDNFYLVKTNSLGDTLWTRAYGANSADRAYCIRQTNDGGYIFTGYSALSGIANNNAILYKTDANGDTLWTRNYGGTGYDAYHHVEQTSDGGYILCGGISYGIGEGGAWLVKTDAMGDTLWTNFPMDTIDCDFQYVQETSDGGYVCCGNTSDYGQPWDDDGFIVKTNAVGDSEWVAVFNLTQWDFMYSVQQTYQGNYIAAGWVDFEPPVEGEMLLWKIDAHGTNLWHRTYEGSGIVSYGMSARQTLDGGYVVAGYTGGNLEEGVPLCYVVRTGIDEVTSVPPPTHQNLPTSFNLYSPYPNPFNPATTITFDIPNAALTKIAVYDLLGRQVALLAENMMSPGAYSIVWNAGDLPSGIYFVHLSSGNYQFTRKTLLLK